MNKIKQLADAAGASTMLFDANGSYTIMRPELEKFAELMILEYYKLCNQWPDTINDVMQRQIREHFGVDR